MAIPVCLSLFPDLIDVSWGAHAGPCPQKPVCSHGKTSLVPQACVIDALELLFLDLEELNPIIPGAVAASKELGRHQEGGTVPKLFIKNSFQQLL